MQTPSSIFFLFEIKSKNSFSEISEFPSLLLKEKYPLYHTQFLLGYLYSEELINKCLEENLNLDLRCDLVTKELVDRFHQKGLEVNTWTVDSKEEYERLKKCGVDYITTNILE